MGQPQRRRKMHSGDTHLRRRWRLRSRKKDLDEVLSKTLQDLAIISLKYLSTYSID